MKRHLLVVLAAAATVASAHAGDPFDLKVADVAILQSRDVQNECGVGAALRERLNGIVQKNNTALQSYIAEQQKRGVDPRKDKSVQDRINGFAETMKSEVLATLTASQLKRLREITLQVTGMRSLTDDTVATRVGLSAKEKTAVKKIFNDGRNQVVSLVSAKLGPIQKKFQGKKPTSQQEADLFQAQFNYEVSEAKKALKPTVVRIEKQTEEKIRAAVNAKSIASLKTLQGATSKAASQVRASFNG